MFNNYNQSQILEILSKILFMEYLGIHIESVDEKACYFSVPSQSVLKLKDADEDLSKKIKNADGLIFITKLWVMEMIGLDEKDADTYRFYATTRNEIWNSFLGEQAVKNVSKIEKCKMV